MKLSTDIGNSVCGIQLSMCFWFLDLNNSVDTQGYLTIFFVISWQLLEFAIPLTSILVSELDVGTEHDAAGH